VATVLLARAGRDANGLMAFVATSIGRAWPEATRIKRRGLFNRGAVTGIEIRLGDAHYELTTVDGRPVATIADAHGGVALSHTKVSVQEWATSLVKAMAAMADEVQQARAALERLGAG
jgi:hypothetical protein